MDINDIDLKKLRVYLFPAIVVIVASLWSINYFLKKNLSFTGVVNSVSYNVKGTPTIKIDSDEYFLNYLPWDFSKAKIEIGDKMMKRKNTFDLYLIKRNSKDTINFYNN